jgi:pimeloyl-ACP methyl ester carboxylesterase
MTLQVHNMKRNKAAAALPWLAGGLAALAGAAVYNHVAARRAEVRHPPMGQFITIDGVAVHYTDSGTETGGDTIVLIHGNGSLLQDFLCAGLVARLKETHRVIAFDRPGYGYTARPQDREWTAEAQAALLAAAARALDVSRPVVVGHSWGTLVALAWALDFPRDVKALALISGYYYPTLRADALALNMAKIPGVRQVFTDAWAPMQTRLVGRLALKQLFAPAELPQHFMDCMPLDLMLRPAQIRATADDGAQMPANVARLSQRYGALRLPISVIWGANDHLVGQNDHSARLVAEVASAEGVSTPDMGHMIHHVEPERMAVVIQNIQFCRRCGCI